MGRFPTLHSLRSIFDRERSTIERIRAMQAAYKRLTDAELCAAASQTEDLPRWIALAVTAAFRVLGQDRQEWGYRDG